MFVTPQEMYQETTVDIYSLCNKLWTFKEFHILIKNEVNYHISKFNIPLNHEIYTGTLQALLMTAYKQHDCNTFSPGHFT